MILKPESKRNFDAYGDILRIKLLRLRYSEIYNISF